ncbi:MAG: DEAD/DEAH box helicase, partial [Peptococcaceae bacterium]|nr:DEAD/DEAH box helicase [Peptococcaceae bacterium]
MEAKMKNSNAGNVHLLDFLNADPELQKIRQLLQDDNEVSIYGLYEGQRMLVTASLAKQYSQKNLLVVCDTEKRAKELWEDFAQLLTAHEVLYFPALEMIPYEVIAQSGELEQKRLEVLAKLTLEKQKQFAVITTIEGLSKKLLSVGDFLQGMMELRVGMILEQQALKIHLISFGYEYVEQVEQAGQFSVRGGIFDIFVPYYKNPLRLEFFDDEIDSIRFFETASQCSIEKIQSAWIAPGSEFFLMQGVKESGIARIREQFALQVESLSRKKDREPVERLQGKVGELLERLQQNVSFTGLEQYQTFFYPEGANLTDYMGHDLFLVLDEANRIQEAQEYLEKERRQSFSDLLIKGGVLPGQAEYFWDLSDLAHMVEQTVHICFSLLPKQSIFQQQDSRQSIDCQAIPSFFGNPQMLIEELQNWQKQNYSILILLTSASKALRLQQMLSDHDILCSWIADRYQADPGKIYLAYGNISHGARFPQSRLILLSETEVFQQQKKRVNKKFFQEDGQKITHLDDLKIGDYVVHLNHGIGRYMGVERLKVQDVERDYLIIKYADDGKLYIPVEQFDLLQKYTVEEGAAPRVNKLGGSEWQRTKNKVKASVEQLAEGLLEIYAKRKSQEGYAFSPDDQWQKEFEDAFPYVETEDQLRAIEDVKRDMMSSTVMDRLICGDVGYGKTEVAIRAAFKAVNDGKQVAILVPTTVLAQQHYNTFLERFSPYGVRVDMLSRFATAKQQKETKDGLKSGSVDIVVGTHKLLSKTIEFHDLGLLIIDEEQRFGVTHKEKIKEMRSLVDVLTLSATPIPRTLHMSLVGIRDMSVIETPPQD